MIRRRRVRGGKNPAEPKIKQKSEHQPRASGLRKEAERRFREEARPDFEIDSVDEAGKFVEELRIHQIELEMQNDELRRAQEEIEQSRSRFFDLYEFAPVGYLTLDASGVVREANLTAMELLGESRKLLLNTPLARWLVPESQDSFYKHFRASCRNASAEENMERYAIEGIELRLGREDRIPPWVLLTGVVIRDPNTEEMRARVTLTDISARKEYEEERLEMLRQIQHAQKLESLGVLAGGVAHDFNNLLQGIRGFAEIAQMELPETAPAYMYVQNILRSTEQAAGLTSQMLAYSGKGTIMVQPLDLNQMVDEVGELLKISISKKAVLRVDLATRLPVIEGDIFQLQQVLMNLVTNASESLGEASGTIRVSSGVVEVDRKYLARAVEGREELPGPYVYLEVADTGCGMSPDSVARIFEPFFTTKFTGRGLGMAAASGIVRGHNGVVTIASTPGKGTAVRVHFRASERGIAPSAVRQERALDSWSGSGTILVVEDEAAVRKTLVTVLEKFGFTTLAAADGPEGLERYREQPGEIDLVLLDMTMPGLRGDEVFRKMLEIRSDARAILMSGYSEGEAKARFSGLNLSAFLQKPFSMESLRRTLQKILG